MNAPVVRALHEGSMKFFRSGSAGEMPFLDHLEELRWRLLWSVSAIVGFALVGFVLVTQLNVLGLLIIPIEPFLEGSKLKYLSPMDPFFITLRLAITVGLILASPVVVYQIWAFLAPALLPSERRVIVPSLYMGLVLFAAGVVLAYVVALPITFRSPWGSRRTRWNNPSWPASTWGW
jgi:sec-independent protein translocase protein TatC